MSTTQYIYLRTLYILQTYEFVNREIKYKNAAEVRNHPIKYVVLCLRCRLWLCFTIIYYSFVFKSPQKSSLHIVAYTTIIQCRTERFCEFGEQPSFECWCDVTDPQFHSVPIYGYRLERSWDLIIFVIVLSFRKTEEASDLLQNDCSTAIVYHIVKKQGTTQMADFEDSVGQWHEDNHCLHQYWAACFHRYTCFKNSEYSNSNQSYCLISCKVELGCLRRTGFANSELCPFSDVKTLQSSILLTVCGQCLWCSNLHHRTKL